MERSRSSVRSIFRKSKPSPNLLRDLRRPDPSRNKKKLILIATEDQKSSRRYFERLRAHLKAHRVIIMADHAGSAPDNVVDAALAKRRAREDESKNGLEDPFDEVWVVFDTEGQQNPQRQIEAKHAIARAKDLGFHTAVSNPCFEYWLLIHFEWCVETFPNANSVSRRLKEADKMPSYDKNFDSFTPTWNRVETAIRYSKRVFLERCQGKLEHPCKCHPSTEIHKLIESILNDF